MLYMLPNSSRFLPLDQNGSWLFHQTGLDLPFRSNLNMQEGTGGRGGTGFMAMRADAATDKSSGQEPSVFPEEMFAGQRRLCGAD